MTELIIDEADAGERRVRLDPGLVTLGHEAENEISFPEQEDLVSPLHASLQSESERWLLRDEGSHYGTFLNGRRVREHGLENGDLIELGVGGPRMRFVTGEGSAPSSEEDDGATEVRRAFRPEDRDAG